jgi:hypothetical protein
MIAILPREACRAERALGAVIGKQHMQLGKSDVRSGLASL